MLVEAADRRALSRGMQSFQISAAKHLNRMLSKGQPERRRGRVFSDRYYAEVITSPTQAHRALSYVLRGSTRIALAAQNPERVPLTRQPQTRLLRVVQTWLDDVGLDPRVLALDHLNERSRSVIR